MPKTPAERVKDFADRKKAEGAKRDWIPASLLRLADERGGLEAIPPALAAAESRATAAETELARLRRHWAVRLLCRGNQSVRSESKE